MSILPPFRPCSDPRRSGLFTLKAALLLLALFNTCSFTFAQHLDPALKPFYHGVASGDPLSDRVIIWTRVTPETDGLVAVTWKIATDPEMTRVVHRGSTTTTAQTDYTVKIDAAGLQPNTTYYYSFQALGKNSLTGRTKTAPVGDVSHLRFAVVSCNNYEGGYFNAFGRIADRNDLDAVIHLGDYIYEQAEGEFGAPSLIASKERTIVPKHEAVTLPDYRQRYAHYRLDTDLRRIHQQHPFITVWDDHESADDSNQDSAANHQPDEGAWKLRKEASRQAYAEWMPIRGTAKPLYRVESYGNLVDLIMIDTRIEGREPQINDVTDPKLYDPNRTILGQKQREWFFDQLKSSKARWKVIGNQVIFSEFNVGWAASPELGTPEQLESLFLDIWDGYPAERQRVIDVIAQNKIDNVVILTGDFHTAFAFDVAARPSVFSPGGPDYDPASGKGSVAVEFAGPSITSANFDEDLSPEQSAGLEYQINKPFPAEAGPLAGVNPNPHMKYVDLDRHGYFILDLLPEKVQADWYFVDDILKPSKGEAFDAGFYSVNGENHLRQATGASIAKKDAAPAPSNPAPVPTVLGFTLVNAETGGDIGSLVNGSVIDFAKLPTAKLSIRANVSPSQVGSVVFGLNNRPRYRVENDAPYALASNNPDNSYVPFAFQRGAYSLKATPYEKAIGKGEAGVPLAITFQVVNLAKIARFVLVDAGNAQDIQEIKDGDVINLHNLSTSSINIRADVDPVKVGSVVFQFEADQQAAMRRIENLLPYAVFSNNADNIYAAYNLLPGVYTLRATPYAESQGKGVPGRLTAINFTVVEEAFAGMAASRIGTGRGEGQPKTPELNFSVFPNPIRDRLTIHFAEPVVGEIVIQLFDVLGRNSYHKSRTDLGNSRVMELDVAHLPGRLYLLSVQTKKSKKVVRIVKE